MNIKALLIVLLAALVATLVIAAGPENERTAPYPPDDELPIPDEESADIMATLDEDGAMSTLISLLHECGLDSVLRQDGPFTLFAPDDSAFAELDQGQREVWLADVKALKALLERHIVEGSALEFEETGETTVKTLDGREIVIVADYEEVTVGGASVIDEGIWCRNGIIHVIDRVLEPAGTAPEG